MSSHKRRQVTKSGIQTQIQFPQQPKGNYESYPLRQDYIKKIEQNQYAMQNGAKDNSTPFRSLNRINKIMGNNSPAQIKKSSSKIIESPCKANPFNQVGYVNYFESKPSSVTTACTQAYSEYSFYKSDTKGRKKREVKSDSKENKIPTNVGKKRAGQQKLENMEYFVRLQSRNAKHIAKTMLTLRDKKTGQTFELPLFQESELYGLKPNPILNSFDMTKLEVEYDYDTDSDQATHSKKMLLHELWQAIDFFIKEDPIKLVDNVLL